MPTLSNSLFDENAEGEYLFLKHEEITYPSSDLINNDHLPFYSAKDKDTLFIPVYFGSHFENVIRLEDDNIFSKDFTNTTSFPGYAGIERPYSFKMSDGIAFFLFLSFFLFVFVLSRGSGYVKQMFRNLVDDSERDSIFVESTTSNEYRFKFFMFLQTAIILAIFIFVIIWLPVENVLNVAEYEVFTHILFYALAILLFWGIKWVLNRFLGYVFFDKQKANIWQSSYFSMLALLSLFLYPILLCVIHAQDIHFLNISKNIFLLFLIIGFFIILRKGIRLFLVKPHGFFYFMLYLCALEIIPCVGLYLGLVYIYNFF